MQDDVSKISAELVGLQRQRAVLIQSRNMMANRLRAIIAIQLGYNTTLTEKERKAKHEEAQALIAAVVQGEADHLYAPIIRETMKTVKEFEKQEGAIAEKPMLKLVKRLPVAPWVQQPEQRGFGLLSLAVVIGEANDLRLYANPAKVWRRFGCAPWCFDGVNQMGSTWKAKGKLPADQWEAFGYSPRRRSVAFLVGENLLKQNHGPYRARYDEAKAKAAEAHPDWPKLRCHRHGMLLATKLLLKNLWVEWTKLCEGTCEADAAIVV